MTWAGVLKLAVRKMEIWFGLINALVDPCRDGIGFPTAMEET
jgi:hypothetical protein